MKKIVLNAVCILSTIIIFTACSGYGEKIEINRQSEVYVKDGATTEEGRKLGEFLLRNNYFDEQSEKSIQLTKDNDTYVVKFIVREEKLKGDEQAELAFRYMNVLLRDSVFGGKPTKIILAGEKFKEIRTIQPLSQEELNALSESGEDSSAVESPVTDSIRQ